MLAHWFNRGGIGQMVAPDSKMKSPDEVDVLSDEAKAGFWHIVAPDPNFAPPKAPPLNAFPPHYYGQLPTTVQCHHCEKWTPVTPQGVGAPPTRSPQKRGPSSPNPARFPSTAASISYSSGHVEQLVMIAARETAVSISSKHIQETRDKLFRMCGSLNPLKANLIKRIEKMITKNPDLIHSRCCELGQLVPDGFTPLMATAYVNQREAAETILTASTPATTVTLLEDRDLQGRSALHIAAERGSLDMVALLSERMQSEADRKNPPTPGQPRTPGLLTSPAPVDILGRTPLGRAIISPNPTARKHQKALEKALFTPGDVSVVGVAKSLPERSFHDEPLFVAYGFADMPGMRITMEDAICSRQWKSSNSESYVLLGVCDGHGDNGYVSQFVANTLPDILQSQMEASPIQEWTTIWTQTCLQVDDKLREEKLPGGSTGVFALISGSMIVVANVGDSRAILVQRNATATTVSSSTAAPEDSSSLEEKVSTMSISETTGESSEEQKVEGEQTETSGTSVAETAPPTTVASGPVVVALSEDHKPNLPVEMARIHKAGMEVVPVTFQEEGKEITIHKVAKSDKDRLAVSRAFGDFEYKLNTTIAAEEQAVSVVPDVRIHTREPDSDQYLVLACDGIWDVMENEDVKAFVLQQVETQQGKAHTGTLLPAIGDSLLHECLNRGSRDNMSVVVSALSKEADKMGIALKGQKLEF